ncbi:hypothetical protein FACS1894139_17500 [Planctomycetales bacterium]|nr:hypothetical protein FACS1894139_17500 [Planctomycetales bacterium]
MAFQIIYYRTETGRQPVKEWIDELAAATDAESARRSDKIDYYLRLLATDGVTIGKPAVDHLDGEIYELRPLRDRVLFAAWTGGKFVLLHHFRKATQKTPRREIEIAKQRLKNFRARQSQGDDNG